MTNQHDGRRRRPTSYGIEEMLRLRGDGTATALLPDATSPVLVAGSWWAVHETDPTGRYRPVQMPAATEQLNEMAGRLVAASAALAALDTEGAGFLPEHPEVLE
jgi:hypothetical protein